MLGPRLTGAFRLAELLARGLTSMEMARALGVSKSTVCYHKRRLSRTGG